MSNRLSTESSPYLKQHAENPVDWYPWGPEALERSVREDRPILLSVGYSACHWCHVMERESFEDPAIAALMNRLYVNIKVDREERPDIDQIYMKAVQAMTGRGGWPMTVFLTPQQVPFFGGTYYPPEPQPGMPSFPQLLESIADAWGNRREEVTAGSGRLLEALRQSTVGGDSRLAGNEVLDGAWRTLANQFDDTHGGFGRAPKFPQPVTLEFLLRHHLRTGESTALEMAVHTLRRMAAGGMRDHLAGGFHRYSVDARWLVPHFEKMLYDNALLVRAYLDAWRVTDSDDLRDVVTHTLDYLVDDMRSPEGGFFSARDADSEGEEGVFYVWSKAEVESLLGEEESQLFCRVYDVTDAGNFEGKSILHLPHPLEAIAQSVGLSQSELERRLEAARATLLAHRADREAPFRDEKVIVSWNGLAIRAFAEAGAALGRQDYIDVAVDAADFIWRRLRHDDRLQHSAIDLAEQNQSAALSPEGSATETAGFLDDHAAFGNACLTLHEATLDARWLESAIWLAEEILNRFWDDEDGTVFDTADDAEQLIIRARDPMDNATPSGASLAAELLARLGSVMDDERYRAVARRIVDREAGALERYGPAFGRMLSVLHRLESAPLEIAIAGGDDEDTRALVREAHAALHTNIVVTGTLDGQAATPGPLLEGRGRLDGQATAYVCSGYTCQLPVTTAIDLRREVADILRSPTG